MKPNTHFSTALSLIIAIVLAIASYTIVNGGNDFINGTLRVDLPEIYNAMDYRVLINSTARASSGSSTFTAGWLGVDLAPNREHFTQVGLQTDSAGIYWFVWAPSASSVTCIQGSQQGWVGTHGCLGANGSLVALNSWYYVELVTYLGQQGTWIARVAGQDVALIHDLSQTITEAYVTMEESYSDLLPQDPYMLASFYFWHPQYMGASGWQDWNESSGGGASTSLITAVDLNGYNTFCPQHYGANPNYAGSERAWYGGTGGQVCSWLLFPSVHIYIPLVMK